MNVSSSDADQVRRRERLLDDSPQTPPPPPTAQQRDAHVDAVIERLPEAHLTLDFSVLGQAQAVTPLDPQAKRDAEVQARMNACRDKASGPYTVNGQQVYAAPMFRMTTHRVDKTATEEMRAIGKNAGLSPGSIRAIELGQGKTEDVVKLTQALVDAGKLRASPADLALRVKRMQWTYGIGFDCAGYSKEAMVAAHGGAIEFRGAGSEDFADADARFQKVTVANARPGDLITLRPAPGERWGHNVVVYGNHLVDDAKRRQIVASGGAAVDAFLASGTVRALEVDSSWGAGTRGSTVGGYRRDTWLYNETTRQWASFQPGAIPAQLVVSDEGPSGDVFHGVYRPR